MDRAYPLGRIKALRVINPFGVFLCPVHCACARLKRGRVPVGVGLLTTAPSLQPPLKQPAHFVGGVISQIKDSVPKAAIPLQRITPAQLQAAPNGSIYRLGHSTLLLKLRDRFWLTDPVFSQRASPVQWFGPKRFHAPPIALADLPPIEAVILSHNHYDHLDRHAVLALAHKTCMF